METILLQPSGYCSGVKRAIDLALKEANKESKPLIMLSPLIHNEAALAKLAKENIQMAQGDPVDIILDAPRGSRILFSAHGHPFSYDELCLLKGHESYDSTCPFVYENMQKAATWEGAICYIGEISHEECKAFLANVPEAICYELPEKKWNPLKLKGKNQPVGILCQTTLGNKEIEEAIEDIRSFFPDATVLGMNCPSTRARQENIERLSDVDALIVLGSTTSSNSKRLAKIGKEKGLPTFLALGLEEVKSLDLSPFKRIALASGASTEAETIQEVFTYLKSL